MDDEFHLVGGCLEGRYDVERFVTAGGFGTVYFGRHRALRSAVAVKVLRLPADLSEAEHQDFTARFLEEARTLAMLQHPAVVRAVDFGVSPMPGGQVAPWMALEWVDGTTLKGLLEARRGSGMAPRDALSLLRPVFEALAEAHARGVVHRDVKPANIMAPSGGGALPTRILDFGIAKVMRPEERERPTGDTGTASEASAFSARYAAPEQIGGARTGPWTDVHALGLVLTELLTGREAYQGQEQVDLAAAALSPQRPTPAALGVDVGTWEPLLARALAFRASDRFSDAGELLAALDAALLTTASPPRAPAWSALATGAAGPLAAASAVVVVAVLIASVALWWTSPRPGAATSGPTPTAPVPEALAVPAGASGAECRGPGALAPVPGLVGVVQVATGGNHTCARLGDGSLRCWGENSDGEVGDGTTEDRYAPTAVLGLSDATQVATGTLITCALHAGGTVSCWGRGIVPGSGEIQNRRPGRIDGVTQATQLAAGLMHACARRADGTAWCWGRNNQGQLGSGSVGDVSGPVRVVGLGPVTQLAAGEDHTCALLDDGTVWCWGRQEHGELGDGSALREGRGTPVRAVGVADAVQVAAGEQYSCARLRSGAVTCWGSNRDGQLGGSGGGEHPTASLVPGVIDAVDLVTGAAHACVRRRDGAVLCWGGNTYCEAGFGRAERLHAPSVAEGFSALVELTAGQAHGCGRAVDGAVRCWGWNRFGQLGNGVTSEVPDTIPP